MSIESIKVSNLLSFDNLIISKFEDINCIVWINNAGKSNLLKLLRFFYNKLDRKRELPPLLNNNYSAYGTISIKYRITKRIKKRFKDKENIDLFKNDDSLSSNWIKLDDIENDPFFDLTLKINSNDSVEWSIKDYKTLNTINYLYPFFDIEGRHISLYNWDKLWHLISSLKSFNIKKLEEITFDKEKLKKDSTYNEYKEYINKINSTIQTSKYTYRDKVLTYIKMGLIGDDFLINNEGLDIQSDGTNSYMFIETFLKLLINLTRREYITPTIYIDEPEVGLHPKKCEELIDNLYEVYINDLTKTPYPIIIFATHSPHIIKQVIKEFSGNQQVLHFHKKDNLPTIVNVLNSKFEDKFLNIFSDNESRLFFSKFILFVEGETELEVFGNKELNRKFNILRQIDVYKSSSNVLGSNINPSNTNSSIPYLFLFDADKIYEFRRENNKRIIKLVNKNKKLYFLPEGPQSVFVNNKFDDLIKYYNKGYNQEFLFKSENLKNIKRINKFKYTFKKSSFEINEKDTYKKAISCLKRYLIDKNVIFVKTTMEEVLINNDSKDIFFKWLKQKYNFNIEILIQKRISYIPKNLIIKRSQSKLKNRKKSHHKNKIKIKKAEKILKRKYITKDLIINYVRILFEGKFEMQVNYALLVKSDKKT